MPEEPLDEARWRSFRIFARELDDAALQGALEQLHAEIAARQEQDRNLMRLLFSSLVSGDLDKAREVIVGEEAARAEDVRMLALARAEREQYARAGTGQDSATRDDGSLHDSRQKGLDIANPIACCSPSEVGEELCCIYGPSGVMDVVTAVPTAKGESNMTMSSSTYQAPETAPVNGGRQPGNKAPGRRRKASAGRKPARKAPRAHKGGQARLRGKSAAAKAEGAREGSKTATVLAVLQRAKGATLAEIMDATGWQAHSVRGFLSGVVGKKMGLKVASVRRDDGQRVYSVRK